MQAAEDSNEVMLVPAGPQKSQEFTSIVHLKENGTTAQAIFFGPISRWHKQKNGVWKLKRTQGTLWRKALADNKLSITLERMKSVRCGFKPRPKVRGRCYPPEIKLILGMRTAAYCMRRPRIFFLELFLHSFSGWWIQRHHNWGDQSMTG